MESHDLPKRFYQRYFLMHNLKMCSGNFKFYSFWRKAILNHERTPSFEK